MAHHGDSGAQYALYRLADFSSSFHFDGFGVAFLHDADSRGEGFLGVALIGAESSDQVYNGCSDRGALPESAVLSPQNVYAVHKLAAEEAVRCLLPDAVGLRLTWMYDRLDSPYRMNRNLLTRLKEAQETGIPVRASVYELRGITNVWEVIRRLPACFGLPGGIYNYGSENALSFYETVRAFARICGYDADAVVEKDLHFTRNLSMSLSRLREYGMDFPASVENCV